MRCLNGGTLLYLNSFRRKLLPIVVQSPRSHILWLALRHADDDVAVPRPGVIAIVLARTRRMIRVRVIPTYNIQLLLPGKLFRIEYILRRDRKAVLRRIIAAIDKRK